MLCIYTTYIVYIYYIYIIHSNYYIYITIRYTPPITCTVSLATLCIL